MFLNVNLNINGIHIADNLTNTNNCKVLLVVVGARGSWLKDNIGIEKLLALDNNFITDVCLITLSGTLKIINIFFEYLDFCWSYHPHLALFSLFLLFLFDAVRVRTSRNFTSCFLLWLCGLVVPCSFPLALMLISAWWSPSAFYSPVGLLCSHIRSSYWRWLLPSKVMWLVVVFVTFLWIPFSWPLVVVCVGGAYLGWVFIGLWDHFASIIPSVTKVRHFYPVPSW